LSSVFIKFKGSRTEKNRRTLPCFGNSRNVKASGQTRDRSKSLMLRRIRLPKLRRPSLGTSGRRVILG
jgi:hypothetical protein